MYTVGVHGRGMWPSQCVLKLAAPQKNTNPHRDTSDILLKVTTKWQKTYFQIVLLLFQGRADKMAREVPEFKTESTDALFGFEQASTSIWKKKHMKAKPNHSKSSNET